MIFLPLLRTETNIPLVQSFQPPHPKNGLLSITKKGETRVPFGWNYVFYLENLLTFSLIDYNARFVII